MESNQENTTPMTSGEMEQNTPKQCKSNPCEQAKSNHGQTVINIVMALAILVLFVINFTNKGTSKKNVDAKAPIAQTENGLTIAYVNTDTLMAKYQYAIDLEEELKQFQMSKEKSYQQQVAQLQKDMQKYLNEGRDMTLSQQQAKETELKQREAKLQSLGAELATKIQEKTISESEKMTRAVYAFIREYNKSNQNFTLILARSFTNSPILYGDEGMDITNEIVEGLNEEYKNIKGKAKKADKEEETK